MNILNKASIRERIGDIQKTQTLSPLEEVEAYFLNSVKRYKIEVSYDVIANEVPYFKTLNYTEWAHSFIMHPLQQEIRMQQMRDAYNDDASVLVDYVSHFKERALSKQSNKYAHIDTKTVVPPRKNLVVLVGSNKLKERICLNKLNWIRANCGTDLYYKPHPFTTYQLVGELRDLFGKEVVLDRDIDVYNLLVNAETVYTSHMSETAIYAVCLGKRIEPIDAYNRVEQGSFYHINKFLFMEPDPQYWVNRTFNSEKSGIINPIIDSNWKHKVDGYLDYLMKLRDTYKNKYIAPPANKK